MKRVHILNCNNSQIESIVNSAKIQNVKIVEVIGNKILDSRKSHTLINYDHEINQFLDHNV